MMISRSRLPGLKTALIFISCAIGVFLSVTIHPVLAGSDYNGDGVSDVLATFDYNNATARIWGFRSDGTSFVPAVLWFSGLSQFDARRSKVLSGDFDGDGRADVAMLYDYGNATSRIWLFKSTGTAVTPSLAWSSGLRMFDSSRAKLASGDFDGDGLDDITALYDYGTATSRLWVFKSDGSTLTPSIVWYSGTGSYDASRAKISGGDYDGDGHDDIAALYDYDKSTSRIWLFKSDGAALSPSVAWSSGSGGFAAGRAAVTSGDYDGDGKTDMAVLYDYGAATARIWVFRSNGSILAPAVRWSSGTGAFNPGRAKITSGDFDGDGKDDVAMLYDYKGATSRFWLFKSDGANLTPRVAWASQPGGFDWLRTRPVNVASASAAEASSRVIGYSLLGRPLTATKIGNGNRRYLFVGVHHGDEPQGGRVLALWRDYLIAHPEMISPGVEVWILPCLNPDGQAAGTRWNARGVDLNRNYGTLDWGSGGAAEHPGAGPFSEPETAAMAGLGANTSFQGMVSFHEPLGCVYWGGSDAGLALLFRNGLGLPLAVDGSPISGTASQWFAATMGYPSATVELTAAQVNENPSSVFQVYLPALLATIRY